MPLDLKMTRSYLRIQKNVKYSLKRLHWNGKKQLLKAVEKWQGTKNNIVVYKSQYNTFVPHFKIDSYIKHIENRSNYYTYKYEIAAYIFIACNFNPFPSGCFHFVLQKIKKKFKRKNPQNSKPVIIFSKYPWICWGTTFVRNSSRGAHLLCIRIWYLIFFKFKLYYGVA